MPVADNEIVRRILLTVIAVIAILGCRAVLVAGIARARRQHERDRAVFWTRQGSSLAAFILVVAAIVLIWVGDTTRSTTVAGFATAGLAVAAQRVVTAFAGYLVIIRGKTFKVGDRIKMGGVRGDVIALAFLQTRILEIGQPPDVNEQDNAGVWVRDRQYSGRIVTVTNDKVFDEPIYNFTREFPFVWEEISIPLSYRADRAKAEQILLSAVIDAAGSFASESNQARSGFERKYGVSLDQAEPRVFWRLTSDWLEMTVRFVVAEHLTREVKDRVNRTIIAEFDAAGIELANTTVEVASLPSLHVVEHSTDTPHGT